VLLYSEQTGLLSEQRLRVLVRVEREHLEAISKMEADFFTIDILLTPIMFRLSYRREKCLSKGHTKWNWSVSSEILDTCCSDECFYLVNQWQFVAAAITTVSLCIAVCVAVSLTTVKQQ